MLERREAAGEAFYDFIGPEEALLGRCWTVIVTLSLIMSPQTGTVCEFVCARVCIVSSLQLHCSFGVVVMYVCAFLFTRCQVVLLQPRTR